MLLTRVNWGGSKFSPRFELDVGIEKFILFRTKRYWLARSGRAKSETMVFPTFLFAGRGAGAAQ